ncbi:ASCH domain-containing protein [Chitinolyticbacter meiyuanensis]|uniref:ASCH domain-containing protein n=1 Tax=Chitinolyticbacter meiyuanensis TaxID=682798 RepID=UPI0011E592B2|nr:ASCH domain-containing protein [Chitinolyticbacter meiyuanensis]
MTTLVLPLKAIYFNQIKDGTKDEEYRLMTPYWCKRLEDRTYDRIVLQLGYPAQSDLARRLVRPWRGYTIKTITHPHFGPDPVGVFAIKVN